MRLVHTADLHFGASAHDWPDPETGISSALLSQERCWTAIVTETLERAPDLAILAGDVFHDRSPSAEALARFARGLGWLKKGGIPVVIVAGNHDRAAIASRSSILEVFDDRPRVFVITEPEIVDVKGIRVAGLPSVSRQQLAARLAGWSRLEVDEALIDGLRRILDAQRAEGADVIAGHWPVAGAVLGSERDIAITEEPMLSPADLEGFRYVAFGHIHKRQPILGPPKATPAGFQSKTFERETLGAYSGGIDRFDFGDEGQQKAALLVTIEPTAFYLAGIETPARKLLTVDLDREDNWTDVADAIVRVRGTTDDAEDVGRELRAALLKDGAALVKLELSVPRKERPRAEAIAAAPGPAEALDLWLDFRNVADEIERREIHRLAVEIWGTP